MRPKHVLWLAAAVLYSAWFVLDPQARIGGQDVRAAQPASDQTPVDLHAEGEIPQDKRITAGL